MAPPRVSVVIPVYNLRAYLGETIESVLGQTLPPEQVEIVVVDDGSTDGSGDVARSYGPRVRCVRQENRGLSAARNAGIANSAGAYLAFLDADDRFLPGKLAAELARFEARPEAGLVYSGWRYVDEAGTPLPQGYGGPEGDVFPRLVLANLLPAMAVLVRRDLVERAGGFDEALTSLEDWDLWLRLSRAGARWAFVDQPLAEYRMRGGGMHTHVERMLENRLLVLDKLFLDPGLPAPIRALRAQAYQNAYLVAACEHYAGGERVAGARAFRAAVRARPPSLADPRMLRRIGRWLLPHGQQTEAAVIADWRRIAGTLRTMLDDLFATPAPDGALASLRWPARRAYWQTVGRFVRRRALTMTLRRGLAGEST